MLKRIIISLGILIVIIITIIITYALELPFTDTEMNNVIIQNPSNITELKKYIYNEQGWTGRVNMQLSPYSLKIRMERDPTPEIHWYNQVDNFNAIRKNYIVFIETFEQLYFSDAPPFTFWIFTDDDDNIIGWFKDY